VVFQNLSNPSFAGTMLHAQMCLVGSRQFNAFGSHGAAEHVSFCHFPTLEECCSHLKDEQGVACDARRSITVRGKSQPNTNQHGPVALQAAV